MGGLIIWLIIMVLVSGLFTGIGIYALKRKTPMWFWSGSVVKEDEISDIPAYNRANGLMWLGLSAYFWLCTGLGLFDETAAGIALIAGCLVLFPLLPLIYDKIYNKYKVGGSRSGK